MLKTLFMSAFAVALVASPSEAQERQTCAWNDLECVRREQERQQPRADERTCKWNDLECLRREQERARREEPRDDRDRDGEFDRQRDGRYDRDGRRDRADARCVERRRNGECVRWERVGEGRNYGMPGRFPKMASALAMRNGRGIPGDARPWVGRGPVRVELTSRDRDRLPERATIRVVGTNETQVWIDRNNDGRADRILVYRNGRLVRDFR
jgi:hypothetical protein